jgi:hypothetical protein
MASASGPQRCSITSLALPKRKSPGRSDPDRRVTRLSWPRTPKSWRSPFSGRAFEAPPSSSAASLSSSAVLPCGASARSRRRGPRAPRARGTRAKQWQQQLGGCHRDPDHRRHSQCRWILDSLRTEPYQPGAGFGHPLPGRLFPLLQRVATTSTAEPHSALATTSAAARASFASVTAFSASTRCIPSLMKRKQLWLLREPSITRLDSSTSTS